MRSASGVQSDSFEVETRLAVGVVAVTPLREMKFNEALEMVDRGEITDAMSIIAIHRLARISGL
jgi:hypothetical protein